MINSITITNSRNESVILDLFDPFSSGFAIQEVEGLGPVNAAINTADYAYKPGAFFLGSRQGTRNIVFNLVFLDTVGTIEQVRHLSYKYWPIGEKIYILVNTDSRVLYTDGYIETNEPAIWDAEHEGCQISVICESPYFISPIEQTNKLSDIRSSFHFPFASTEDPELVFGYQDVHPFITAVNNGDVETGAIFELRPSVPVDNISIFRYGVTEPIFKIKNTLEAGDVLTINSETGSKSITLRRNNQTYNAINYLDYSTGIQWPTLRRGDNAFSVAYTSFETTSQISVIPSPSMQLLDVAGNSSFSSVKMEFSSFDYISKINTYRSGSDQTSYTTYTSDIFTESYVETTDKTPQSGTTYYTKNGDVYTVASVTKGFVSGITYYVKVENGYKTFCMGTFDPISGKLTSTHDRFVAGSYEVAGITKLDENLWLFTYSGRTPFTFDELDAIYNSESVLSTPYTYGGEYVAGEETPDTFYLRKHVVPGMTSYYLYLAVGTSDPDIIIGNLKVVIPKTTPEELYLDKKTITTYAGENNIWTDTNLNDIRGNITEIDYRTPIVGSDQLTMTIKHKNKYLGV